MHTSGVRSMLKTFPCLLGRISALPPSENVEGAILAAVEGVHFAVRTLVIQSKTRVNSSLYSAGLEARLYGRPEARRYMVVFWTSGKPDKLNVSRLYFGNATGDGYRQLPLYLSGEFATPIEMKP